MYGKNDLNFKLKLKFFVDIALMILFLTMIFISKDYIVDIESFFQILLFCSMLFILQYFIFHNIILRELQEYVGNNINTKVKKLSQDILKCLDLLKENNKFFENFLSNVSSLKNHHNRSKSGTKNAVEQTKLSLEYSNKEMVSIKTNMENMILLKQKIQMIAELIVELSEYIQQIEATISIVEDIAEQTNMLALNAAVEAARAGEHGKGFAVVASEIRKLADDSKQATGKVSNLIGDIQYVTNSTVIATEEGAKEVEATLEIVSEVENNVNDLINQINELSLSIKDLEGCSSDNESNLYELENLSNKFQKDFVEIQDNIEKNIKTIESVFEV